MDKDSEKLGIAPENYLDALNIHNGVAESGEFGVVTNAIGNRNVPYTQTGTNKVIGTYRDEVEESVFLFVWNSLNNHFILRYYKGGTIETVVTYNFGWGKDKFITHTDLVRGEQGELLFWTDDKTRKINVTKSTANKSKTYDIVIIVGGTITATITSGNGTVLSTQNLNVSLNALALATLQLNNAFGFYGTFTLCDDKIEFEFNQGFQNSFNATLTVSGDGIAIPSNHYSSITDQIVYAGKYPLLCRPTITTKSDPSTNYNLVDRKVFQFRTKVLYDDFDESALSPISDISQASCGANFNYIEVDYTDAMLNTLAPLSTIRAVEILVREGNTGRFKVAKRIEREELWQTSLALGTNLYNFYNDGTYTVIDDAEALKQYDAVPIEPVDSKYSISQVFADDRIMYGKFKENYEQPCTNATIDVGFEQPQRKTRFNIIGKIRIYNEQFYYKADFSKPNTWPSYKGYIYNQGKDPLGVQKTDTFGGLFHFGNWTNGGVFDSDYYYNGDGPSKIHQQYLPEGGWPVYLAGTDYFAISKQKDLSVSQISSGAIDVSTTTLQGNLSAFYSNTVKPGTEDVYSEFSIKNVPAGRYVVRIASHWCSFGDTLGKGKMYDLNNGQAYQRTSTTTRMWSATGNNIGAFQDGIKEVTVEIRESGSYQVYVKGVSVKSGTVSSGNVDIGQFLIEDLTHIINEKKLDDAATNSLVQAFKDNLVNFIATVLASGTGVGPGIFATQYESKWKDDVINMLEALGVEAGSASGYVLDSPNSGQEAAKLAPVVELNILENSTASGIPVVPYPSARLTTDHNGFWYWRSSGAVSLGVGDSLVPSNTGFLLSNAANGDVLRGVASSIYINKQQFDFSDFNALISFGNSPSINSLFLSPSNLPFVLTNSILKDLYEDNSLKPLTTNLFTPGASARHTQYLVMLDQNMSKHKTIVQGKVVDGSGNGLSGIEVVIERNGRQEETDASGNFSILVYEDLIAFNSNRIIDDIILNSCVCCEAIFTNNYIPSADGLPWTWFDLNIQNFDSPYNSTTPYAPAWLNNVLATLSAATLNKYLKGGGKYRFALMFVDYMNRRHAIEVIDDIYIPFITENVQDYYTGLFTGQAEGTFTLTLNLAGVTPPSWASKLYILRTKNATYNSYIQMPIGDVNYVLSYDSANNIRTDTTYSAKNANEIFIFFDDSLVNYKDFNSDSVLGTAYPFNEGDRLRLIRTDDGALSPTFIDVPILDKRQGAIVIANNDDIPELKAGAIIEIMTPKLVPEDDTEFFYEIPYCIDIVNGAFTQNSIQIVTGDTYRRDRTVLVGNGTVSGLIEDAGLSDFWESIAQDIGRINIDDPTFGQLVRYNAIRFSNKFIPGTKTNGLASFEPANVSETPRELGAISAMKLASDDNYRQVILALHEKRTASIYLGTVEFSDVAGQDLVALSNEVLGSIRTMRGDFGTINPESVYTINGNVFFWDGIRNKFVKYSVNGLDPISDRGIKSFVRNINPISVITTFDRYHNEFVATWFEEISFTYSNGVLTSDADWVMIDNELYELTGGQLTLAVEPTAVYKGTTIAYNEDKNGWVSRKSFTPENYGTIGENIVSFVNGEIWVHDTGRANYYGTQYASQLRAILKDDRLKIFNRLHFRANQAWTVPEISIEPNVDYPNGMLSRLKANQIKLKQGRFYAEFNRDIKDPIYNVNDTVAEQNNALLKGRKLLGDHIELLMEYSGGNATTLRIIETEDYENTGHFNTP